MRHGAAAQRAPQGIALAIAAVACLAALDTSTKYVAPVVPLVVALWCRFVFQASVTAAAMLPTRGRALLRTRRPGLQLLRGVLMVSCSACAFVSFRIMPVGDVTAIAMLAPIAITVLAMFGFGERLSTARLACVAGGFIGALVVVRPGGSMLGWALLAPFGMLATNTAFQLVTSRLAMIDDPATTHFYTGCIGLALTTLLVPFFWTSGLAPSTWGLLLLLGVLGTVGHFLLILAYQRAPATTVMPFLYTQIAFAVLGGWLVFAHVPDAASWLGIALIAVSGATGTWLAAREKRAAVALAVLPLPP